MKKIRFGIIGLGKRGSSLIKTIISCGEVDIVALCDVYQDRVDDAIKVVKENSGVDANGYTDYLELLKAEKLDGVFCQLRVGRAFRGCYCCNEQWCCRCYGGWRRIHRS